MYIEPGSPWQNGYAESFHARLRDELLGTEVFTSVSEAKVMALQWRLEYNHRRPHSSLKYQTPAAFAGACEGRRKDAGCAVGGERFSPPEDSDGLTPLSSEGQELVKLS